MAHTAALGSLLLLIACSSTAPSAGRPEPAKPAETPTIQPSPMLPGPPVGLLSAGYSHQCCIASDTRVLCNGSNKQGQMSAPDGRFSAVSAGLYATCAIDENGRPACWGTSAPEVKAAANAVYKSVATGDGFACALRVDGAIDCWGADDFDQKPNGKFTTIVAGHKHVCGMRESGQVVCAGRAGREPMACADLEDVPAGVCQPGQMVPRSWTPAPEGLVAQKLSGGASHNCAESRDGKVVCWGAWGWGDGNSIWSGHMAIPEAFDAAIVKLTGGGGLSCALLEDQTVVCWGYQSSPPGRFVDIDGGSSGLCGIREGGAMECFTYSSFAGLVMDQTPLSCATP